MDIRKLALSTVAFLTRQRRPEMLIERVLARGSVAVLAAPAYSGKTFWALEAMRAVATGTPFMGHFKVPRPGNVLYLGNDSPPWDLAQQFDKLIGLPETQAADIDYLIETTDLGAYRFIFDPGFALNAQIDAAAVIEAAKRAFSVREYEHDEGGYTARRVRGTDLIVIDTLRSVHGFEENDNTGMQHVMNLLRYIATATNASVLALHHFNKGSKESPQSALERVRGATAIGGAVDSVFALESKGKDGHRVLRVLKHRPCPEQGDFTYEQVDSPDGVTLRMGSANNAVNMARYTHILALLTATSWSKTTDLAWCLRNQEPNLTPEAAEKAVNRALAALEKDGKVVRVHGAARRAVQTEET